MNILTYDILANFDTAILLDDKRIGTIKSFEHGVKYFRKGHTGEPDIYLSLKDCVNHLEENIKTNS